MGLIAELGRLAVGSWSPGGSGGGYIATGTYAGHSDPAFGDTTALELLSVDIQRCKLIPTSTLKTQSKFCSLDWGNPSRSHPAGLIAGGLADGTVCVWDAATVLRTPKSHDDSHAVVYSSATESNKHTAPVRGVAFNPSMQRSLLASGGADGQVLIWDLSNPSAGVTCRHPASKSGSATAPSKEDVTTLAWNRKVHNILSTATNAGVMNVWDLKQSRQVISIRNPRGRLRCSSLAWHPEIPTQIVITCDEDDSTGALLWDLRNATSPVMSFAHHSPKGIVSASWSSHDSDLLLTSSKDSRTVVVSVSSGEVVIDSRPVADWNFDVKWSPRIPGLYLASSIEGRLSVNSVLTAPSAPSVSSETATALAESFGASAGDFRSGMADQSPRTTDAQNVMYNLNRPPSWMKRQSGVSLVFGGLKAHFSAKDGANVNMDSFAENIPPLSSIPGKLDKMLMDLTAENPSLALDWCNEKISAAESPKDKMGWEVLSILFGTDSRRKLIEYLGFSLPPKDAGDDIAMPVYGLLQSQPIAVPVRPAPPSSSTDRNDTSISNVATSPTNGVSSTPLDGPAPWDVTEPFQDGDTAKGSLLDGDDAQKEANGSVNPSETTDADAEDDSGKYESQPFVGKSPKEIDVIIRRAVIVGDFKTAVDACLHAEKTADALVIAHAGGPDLWYYTQAEYLSKVDLSSGSKVIGAVAGQKSKMDEYIIQASESGDEIWKEALAALITYTPAEELFEACTALGNRLMHKKNDAGALVCFLCASNIGMVASTWICESPVKGKSTSAMMKHRVERLCNLVERVRLFTTAVVLSQGEHEIGSVRAFDEVSGSILCEFGALLAAHGNYYAAVTYLSNLDPTYSCGYGSAEELNMRASDCLAISESSNVTEFPSVGNNSSREYSYDQNAIDNFPAQNFGGPTQSYVNPSTIGRESKPYDARVPSNLNDSSTQVNQAPYGQSYGLGLPSLPPVPRNTYGPVSTDTRSTPNSALPPPPLGPAPVPSAGIVSAGAGNVRPGRDPTSVYADSSVNSLPVPPPQMPPPYVPPPHVPAPNVPPPHVPAPNVPSPPLRPSHAPPPHEPSVGPPAFSRNTGVPQPSGNFTEHTGDGTMPDANGGYGRQGYYSSYSSSSMHQNVHAPPPPPPPPTNGEAPVPTSIYAKGNEGMGANLPPSAEVAVEKLRQTRALSTSGTPGGPPKRSGSASSSLSALVAETVYLDKADVSKIGQNEIVIVKALRNALNQARAMNQSGIHRRKMDDVNKRLGKLVAGLNAGLVDRDIVEKMESIAKALEKSNYQAIHSMVAELSKQYWDTNRQWIQGLKWLVDAVVSGR